MTPAGPAQGAPAFGEYVALLALLISLPALSIDAILPALPDIGADLGPVSANAPQLVVSTLILGLGAGQLVFGPWSDSAGRKVPIYTGLALFVAGCVIVITAQTFETMLLGRFVQGVGAAAPRTVSVALVRDRFEGRAMARVMSFVMTVFILVPALAPAIGQGILLIGEWRAIFGLFLALAVIAGVWLAVRLPETLPDAQRRPFSVAHIAAAGGEVLASRTALGHTLTAGVVFGAFLGYLTSAQAVFQVQYELGDLFPAAFATLALALGAASLTNARLVMRHGMLKLSRLSLIAVVALSTGFLGVTLAFAGHPPLWSVITYFVLAFFAVGLLFGNLNALAMEPLGHIAGVGASVVGAGSMVVSVPLGVAIGQAYDGTLVPLVAGFAVLPAIGLVLMRWTTARRTGASAG